MDWGKSMEQRMQEIGAGINGIRERLMEDGKLERVKHENNVSFFHVLCVIVHRFKDRKKQIVKRY